MISTEGSQLFKNCFLATGPIPEKTKHKATHYLRPILQSKPWHTSTKQKIRCIGNSIRFIKKIYKTNLNWKEKVPTMASRCSVESYFTLTA